MRLRAGEAPAPHSSAGLAPGEGVILPSCPSRQAAGGHLRRPGGYCVTRAALRVPLMPRDLRPRERPAPRSQAGEANNSRGIGSRRRKNIGG